jgi:hypothetical protein
MRRYNPALIAPNYSSAWRLGVAHDQAFCTLTMPTVGTRTWNTLERIVAEWQAPAALDPYALINWPATPLPFFVRDNGVRYALNITGYAALPSCYWIPYNGNALTSDAVYEMWSTSSSGSAAIPAFTMTISRRTQLCCDETAGTNYTATPYSPYGQPYPVYYPITTVPVP